MDKITILPIIITRKTVQNKSILLQTFNSLDQNYDEKYELIANELLCDSNNSLFLNGILASSDSLHTNYIKTQTRGITRPLNKKQRQIIESTLDFYGRSAFKTTPFNTFTKIIVSSKGKDNLYHNVNSRNFLHSSINTSLYDFVIKNIKNTVARNLNAKICLNPTIEISQRHYYFWENRDNINNFQKLQKNQILELILDKFHNKVFTVSDLVGLLSIRIDSTDNEISDYLHKLFNLGFFKLYIIGSFQSEDRDNHFLLFLEQNKEGKDLIGFFEGLINEIKKHDFYIDYNKVEYFWNKLKIYFRNDFEKSTIKEHKDSESNPEITTKPFTYKKYKMFYSDYFSSDKVEINYKTVKDKISTINSYIKILSVYDNKARHKNHLDREILDYLKTQSIQEVKLTDFYKYYCEKLNSEKSEDSIKSLENKWRNEYADLNEKLKENIKINNLNSQDVVLSLNQLKKTLTNNNNLVKKKSSHSVYVLPLNSGAWYLDSVGKGYGMTIGRFLNSENFSELSNKILEHNTNFLPDRELCDMVDASIFNGNIHPQLTHSEILLSSSPTYISEKSKKINVSELYITLKENQVILYSKKINKRIYPVHLSLQRIDQRSGFYQFLNLFTENQEVGFSQIINITSEAVSSTKEGVKTVPRIWIENNILLSRKRWIINSDKFKPYFKEKPGQTMKKIQDSLAMNKCPPFFFIRSLDNNKYNKGVFSNVANPIFFKQLKKIILGSDFIEISEVLPNSKFSKEHIITWYCKREE